MRLTRRGFLKKSAIAVGAGVAASMPGCAGAVAAKDAVKLSELTEPVDFSQYVQLTLQRIAQASGVDYEQLTNEHAKQHRQYLSDRPSDLADFYGLEKKVLPSTFLHTGR